MTKRVRIFWPRHTIFAGPKDDAETDETRVKPRIDARHLIGWTQELKHEVHFIVADAVPASSDWEELLDLVNQVSRARVAQRSKWPLHFWRDFRIVGKLQSASETRDVEVDADSAQPPFVTVGVRSSGAKAGSEGIRLGRSSSFRIASIRCVLNLRLEERASTTFILYDPPSPHFLCFLTLERLRLSTPYLDDQLQATSAARGDSIGISAPLKQKQVDPTSDEALLAKLENLHRLERPNFVEENEDEALFRTTIGLLNQCVPTLALVAKMRNAQAVDSGSATPAFTSSLKPWWSLLSIASTHCGHLTLLPLQTLQVALIKTRIRNSSMTARQIELRCSQIILWPVFAATLRTMRKHNLAPISSLSANYITLWSGVWLIANDVVFGQAAASILLQMQPALTMLVRSKGERYLIAGVEEVLDWLEAWPAGLKLNTELSLFFGEVYKGFHSIFSDNVLAPLFSASSSGVEGSSALLMGVITVLAYVMRYAGLTMGICILSDLLALVTLHLTLFHTISLFLYNGFLRLLGALFHLFRGKKRNPLRQGRIDDASYELDQMLLGSILFTLLLFLFPTVATYYYTAALAKWTVVATRATLDSWTAVLNHLPLFALLLRMKDPKRLPKGVCLVPMRLQGDGTYAWNSGKAAVVGIRTTTDRGSTPPDSRLITGLDPANSTCSAVLELRNVPLSVGDIFDGYGSHLARFRQLPGLLLGILNGRSMR